VDGSCKLNLTQLQLQICRGVTVLGTSSTLMHTSQTSMAGLRRLKTVCACMRKTMALCGSIRIGEQVQKKSGDPAA
jgi:hypothetical protein